MSELSRTKFLRTIAAGLEEVGYKQVYGRTAGAGLHCFIPVYDGLILNLALEGSTLRGSRTTASFYLSISFTWSFLPESFPSEAYQRIGRFMTVSERRGFTGQGDLSSEVTDVWRDGYNAESANLVLEAVAKAQPRFLKQANLRDRLRKSTGLRAHALILKTITQQSRRKGESAPEDLEPLAKSAIESVTGRVAPLGLIKLTALDAFRVKHHLGFGWQPRLFRT